MSRDLPLEPARIFRNKRLFVIGGTGFLGKVWLSMLLHEYPEIGHIDLVVRPKPGLDPEARFWGEIAPSPVFDPLRRRYPGDAFRAFLGEKVTPVAADIATPDLGLSPETLESMRGRIDAVVNASGLVDFNPPLDEAIATNAFGIQHLVAFTKRIGSPPLFHTSTCYVAGNRDGVVPEIDPRTFPFPRADELDPKDWDPRREITECVDMVTAARRRCEDAFRQSAFLDRAKRNLRARNEPTQGPALEDELRRVKRKFISDQLAAAGLERARFWGWPNTYTYTKSIGEQILLDAGLTVAIGRPAIIESSIAYPFPGWNEGVNTSAPLILMVLKGHVQFPTRPGVLLDLIPVDFVAAAMIAHLAALLEGTHDVVCQYACGDVNPLSMERAIELTGLAKRRRYASAPGNPIVNFLQRNIEPVGVSKATYARQGAATLGRMARGVARMLEKGAPAPIGGPLRSLARAVERYGEVATKTGEIIDLFIPFMHDGAYLFRCDNTRRLFDRMGKEDRARLPWYPEKIDWRQWFLDIHVPAIEKWVEPEVAEKLAPKRKPLRRHAHLWAMVEDLALRHGHAPALLYCEGERLWRRSFLELRDRACGVAALLAGEGGVRPGDRVVLTGRNHPDWVTVYFGILRAGGTVVPVDPDLPPEAFHNVLRACGARIVVRDARAGCAADLHNCNGSLRTIDLHEAARGGDPRMAPPVEISPEGVASLIFTSGTTGTPKGVMLTHENFCGMIAALAPIFPLGGGDCALSVLPLHHTFEFTCGLLLPLASGARIVYLDEVSGERLAAAMKVGQVTAMVGVPALWQLIERRIAAQVSEKGTAAKFLFDTLLALNRRLGEKTGIDAGRILFGPLHRALGGRLRYLVSGGAALPEETHAFFAGLGLHLTEGYGLTEAAPVLTVAEASPKAKPGQVGKPVPGVEVRIEAPDEKGVGEIVARGPNVMKGYANDEAANRKVFTEDGWLRTGDLGRIDREGRLQIMGRAKEVIVAANGENVYPDDVEAMMGKLPHVTEYTILGFPDGRGGERVACLAVPEPGNEEDHAERIARARESLRVAIRKLPRHARPAIVHFYDAPLPRTATRKVKRTEARRILERLVAASEEARTSDEGPVLVTEVKRAVAAVAGRPIEEIHPHTRLLADLGFESLTFVELVSALDGIAARAHLPPVDAERIMQCETVADVEAAVGELGEAPSPPASAGGKAAPFLLPEPVRERAKGWMRGIQLGFYDRFMRTKVHGRGNIPQNRNTIVVSNHCSHLDLGLIKYALGPYGKDLVTLGAKDYFFEDWRGHYFRNFTNVVPVDRYGGGKEGLETARRIVERGETLLIFPEGTRSVTGEMQPFRPGCGYLVLDTGVDLLPIHLSGTFESLPKGGVFPTKRDLEVRIGPPLAATRLVEKVRGMPREAAARTIAAIARAAVAALRDGKIFDLETFSVADLSRSEADDPLADLFHDLKTRFVPGSVEKPVRFYFSLGEKEREKWTVVVDRAHCEIHPGKPEGGVADCVLKTNPAMMSRIVRESYVPSPPEFLSGAVKTNNVALLQTFARIFNLTRS